MRAKTSTSLTALGVLLVLLAATVSCGDEEDTSTPPTTGTTPPGDNTKAAPSVATGDYEELASVPNAGTITGTVTYTGDREAPPLEVTKDEGVCSHGGEPNGSLVVSNGRVANALVYLVDVPRGKTWSTETPTLDNSECLFVPRVVVSRRRATIAIRNSDPLLHNTNLTLREGGRTLANLALPRQGQVIERSLRRTGLVEAKCDVHPWMLAFILVTRHPYAAVTGEDGTFAMNDVPPGEYQAKVWHEVLGERDVTVTVADNGSATLDVAFE